MVLTVTDIIKETPEALTICFKNGNLFNKLKYLSGQFIELDFKIGKETLRRKYYFSSSPDTDKDIRIIVKKVPGDKVSNFIYDELKIGDKVKGDEGSGSFTIEPKTENKNAYILFGAGSGIVPIFSILKSILAKESNSKVVLINSNKNKENIIFYKELKALKENNYTNFFIEHILIENTNPKHITGFLNEDNLDTIFSKYNLEYDDHRYMMCGPNEYMDNAVNILYNKGIDRHSIELETFKTPNIKVNSNNLISNVTLKYKEETHTFKVPADKTILQEAMNNGIALPYSCRSGNCKTCKGNCTDGKTTMNTGHILTEEQVNNNQILTCITYPNSENVTIVID